MNEVYILVCLLGMPACFLVNLSQQNVLVCNSNSVNNAKTWARLAEHVI